jgi:carbon storage regulator
MLILTRRIGETVLVGDDITIKVVGINGNQIRIGIDAPLDVQVLRSELLKESETAPDDSHP